MGEGKVFHREEMLGDFQGGRMKQFEESRLLAAQMLIKRVIMHRNIKVT